MSGRRHIHDERAEDRARRKVKDALDALGRTRDAVRDRALKRRREKLLKNFKPYYVEKD